MAAPSIRLRAARREDVAAIVALLADDGFLSAITGAIGPLA